MPQPLQEWRKENIIDEACLYRNTAMKNMHWVEDTIGSYLFKQDTLVAGYHVSKSIRLPVFLFRIGTYQIALRFNFYDWCVRVYTTDDDMPSIPKYIADSSGDGFYEGMEFLAECDTQYCFARSEDLFAYLKFLASEIQ